MAVESDADRAVYLNPDEFGTLALYTPAGGSAVEIAGIFDAPHLQIRMGDLDAGITSASPSFLVRSADLPAGAAQGAGDTIDIGGTVYRVVEIAPDGTGMTLLVLAA